MRLPSYGRVYNSFQEMENESTDWRYPNDTRDYDPSIPEEERKKADELRLKMNRANLLDQFERDDVQFAFDMEATRKASVDRAVKEQRKNLTEMMNKNPWIRDNVMGTNKEKLLRRQILKEVRDEIGKSFDNEIRTAIGDENFAKMQQIQRNANRFRRS